MRAHETVAGKQAQRPPHVMNRHEQLGLVLSTDLKRLTAQLPDFHGPCTGKWKSVVCLGVMWCPFIFYSREEGVHKQIAAMLSFSMAGS